MDDLTRLVFAARFGNRGALDSLLEATYSEVRKLCAILVDDDSADDLAQETFIRVVRGLRYFRADSSARTWMLSIARNTCADELRVRMRQRRRHQELIARASVAAPGAEDLGGTIALLDLVRRLTPERREAFVMTQLLELTYDEAAIACACPVGTIHSRVARARADLIVMLGEAAKRGSLRATPGRESQGEL